MTTRRREAASLDLFGRTLYDTGQVLESAEGVEERVLRALELMGQILPYDQCALLDAEVGLAPRLLVIPAMPRPEKGELTAVLVKFFGKLLEEHTRAPEQPSKGSESQLAVPLIGLDEVIGVLFVRRGKGAYEKLHLQILSVVAAKLAAYLMMLRARDAEIKRARELEEARLATKMASRAKEEFLKPVSLELKTPLAAALARVRILASKELPEAERVSVVEAIEHSVRVQAQLVEDLIDLMMLRAHDAEIQRARELEDARLATEMANRAKEGFLKLVSLELKTPLAAALAQVRILGSKELPEAERVRAVEAIEHSVRAQTQLVEDLIDLASIATEVRLDLRPIEPAKSIEAAIDGLRPLAKQRSIRLEATLDPSVQPLVADPERLDEVLTILLANAIKFTPDGGRVEIRLEPAGAGARIQVIDIGKGIGPDRLPHVFDRFSQDDKLTRLAIAKHLVELHGGSIRAESAGEEKGATFTVELRPAGSPAQVTEHR
jgi:signal transduction histidine kinase